MDEGSSLRRNSANDSSLPQAASSANIACCFAVSAGRRASGMSTANRSILRASRSTAVVSRAIHFFRTIPASTGSVAAVAVRSVETFTGSPFSSRASTRCSRSCSSGESFPLRFVLPFELLGPIRFARGWLGRASALSSTMVESLGALASEVCLSKNSPGASGPDFLTWETPDSPSTLPASTSRPKSEMR